MIKKVKKPAPTALQKPTRELVQFLYWLKANMEFYPDICIDVSAGPGTLGLYSIFAEAKHLVVESEKSHQAALKKALKKHVHVIFPEPVSSRKQAKVERLDTILKGEFEGRKIVMRVADLGRNNEVLKGASKIVEQADVVIIKTPFYRFWGDDQADFFDVVDYMKEQGFVVFDMIGGIFKPNNRALGQIDLAFVKEVGPLRPHHHW